MSSTADVRELPEDVAALKAIIAEQRQQILRLEHENRLLRREMFAPKSERRPSQDFALQPGQMHLLFPELVEAAERLADEKGVQGQVELHAKSESRAPKRRKQFPQHLPMIRTTLELPPEARRCSCGTEMVDIGDEITKELERLEICVVHEIVRKKYGCKECGGRVLVAPAGRRVIDKGILGVGFLAHLLVERFGHHMPYNRLESKYAAEGLGLSRSLLCESALKCAELLAPIAEQLRLNVLSSGVVQTDDTPVTIQEGSQLRSRQGYVWVYRGLDGNVFFDMTESRSRDGPAKVLAGYRGYLQADAYAAYDDIYRAGEILEVGCWAHARRYFIDAEFTEPLLSKEAVARIGELYLIERRAKALGLSSDQVHSLRQTESLPRLERLRDWLAVTRNQVLDRGPMAKAIHYVQSNWRALTRYCDDGRLSIDNNPAERALRSIAVGRKNWIFFGNERGGKAAAVLYSLIGTCKEHGIEPRTYLRDVLLRIGSGAEVSELTPLAWKARWLPTLEDHRASILERVVLQLRG